MYFTLQKTALMAVALEKTSQIVQWSCQLTQIVIVCLGLLPTTVLHAHTNTHTCTRRTP